MAVTTRADLYTFLTSLLNDIQIDETLFETLLDACQTEVESIRPWVLLRAEDSSQQATSSTTFQSSFLLPADFKEWYGRTPIMLVDSDYNPIPISEVPFKDRFQYQKSGARFCVDYPNNKLYILGTLEKTYTIYMSYIKNATLISSSATQTWVSGWKNYTKLLALMMAEKWKNGIDYDVFSDAQANQQGKQAQALLQSMIVNDNRLQKGMQNAVDPFDVEMQNHGQLSGNRLF